jgi:hypothetical protein
VACRLTVCDRIPAGPRRRPNSNVCFFKFTFRSKA